MFWISSIWGIKKLSRLKINYILLEYEDKLHYDSHPIVAHPHQAYSKSQIRQLVDQVKINRKQFIRIKQGSLVEYYNISEKSNTQSIRIWFNEYFNNKFTFVNGFVLPTY